MHLMLVAAVVAVSACNSPDTDQLMECGPGGTCPPGFQCNPLNNKCYAAQPDAAAPDARPTDARSVDASPDARPATDGGVADAAAPADAAPAADAGGPPTTTILKGAENGKAGATVTFTYSSVPGALFDCGLDGAFAFCDVVGKTFTGLVDKSTHTFQVRANLGGVTGPVAMRTFTVDAVAPTITINTPKGTVGGNVSVTFTVSEPGATLTCTLGSNVLATCMTGMTLPLAQGSYTLVIDGVDAAGNKGSASTMFTVDTTPPNVVFVDPGDGQVVCTNFDLSFQASPAETGATFACSIDSGPTQACNGGTASFSGVSAGSHTVKVLGTDSVGNSGTDTETVNVDLTAPTVTIAPPDTIPCSSGNLTYEALDAGGVGGSLEVVYCAMTDGLCNAGNGVINFFNASSGMQTITIDVMDACGNEGQGTLQLMVDSAGPTFSNFVVTPGPVDSGTVTMTFTASETATNVNGGIALTTPLAATPAPGDFIPSCSCTSSSCSCSQLAAGTNVIAVQGTDMCGNASTFSTTTVNASFGSYAGHAVLIGHDYSDPNTPDGLVANGVALTPFVKRALPINRNARVLAFRAGTGDGAAVNNVLGAIETGLGAKFDMNDLVSYREISDSTVLPSMLRGRDVLLIYDPKGNLTSGQLDAAGASWESSLVSFTNGGGIVVALQGSIGGTTAGETWRLVTMVNVTGSSAIPAPPNQISSHTNTQMYPAAVTGTSNFYVAQGAPASYPTPAGSSCFARGDQMAAVVYELIDAFWWGDGIDYSFCPVVLDQVMPAYTLSVAVTGDPVPGIPSCVPPITDGIGGGTITVTPQGGQPSPGTTFECYYGDLANTVDTGFPMTACTAGSTTFSYDTGSRLAEPILMLNIALINASEPARVTTVPVVIDTSVDDLSVTSPGAQRDHWCADWFEVLEYGPRDLPDLDQACADSWPQYPYAPIKNATCQLWQYNPQTQQYDVLRSSKTGTGCGLAYYNGVDANAGYASTIQTQVDWRSEICQTNSFSSFYRMVVTMEDYHGNVVSESGSWYENNASSSYCCTAPLP